MSERIDVLHDYGRYDDMAFPYPYNDLEDDFPIHFPNQTSRIPEDPWESSSSSNDDFWDSNPCFWSITSDEEWKKMEELTAQVDAEEEEMDREFFKFEKSPLRHHKKKGWKNSLAS